jgi:IclR family acetate operon transcriptional repressor
MRCRSQPDSVVAHLLLDNLRLSSSETAHIGMLADGHMVYVAMTENDHCRLRMTSHVGGGRDHAHSTALGKAMLAFLPEHVRDDPLAGLSRRQVTPCTIVDLVDFRTDFAQTRRPSFAVENEENAIGARCIGVPILDDQGHPLAAIRLFGPIGRVSDHLLTTMAEQLWQACRKGLSPLGHHSVPIVLGLSGNEPALSIVAADVDRGGDI